MTNDDVNLVSSASISGDVPTQASLTFAEMTDTFENTPGPFALPYNLSNDVVNAATITNDDVS